MDVVMKKRLLMGLIIILLIIVVVSGYIILSNQNHHFDNGKISFDYSSDVIVIDNSNTNSARWPTYLRIFIPDDGTNEDVVLHSEELNSTNTLNNVMGKFYYTAKNGTLNGKYKMYNLNNTLDGWTRYWIIDNSTVYVLEIPVTTPVATQKVSQILNTFEIK
jgi:hypothetical protein